MTNSIISETSEVNGRKYVTTIVKVGKISYSILTGKNDFSVIRLTNGKRHATQIMGKYFWSVSALINHYSKMQPFKVMIERELNNAVKHVNS